MQFAQRCAVVPADMSQVQDNTRFRDSVCMRLCAATHPGSCRHVGDAAQYEQSAHIDLACHAVDQAAGLILATAALVVTTVLLCNTSFRRHTPNTATEARIDYKRTERTSLPCVSCSIAGHRLHPCCCCYLCDFCCSCYCSTSWHRHMAAHIKDNNKDT